MSETLFQMTVIEKRSGFDRLMHAEALIARLPQPHEGADTWLMNYGTGERAQRLRAERGLKFDDETRAAY